MSSLQGRLQSPDYINWVKAVLCLIHTKEGLEDFADSESKLLHQNILNILTRASVPTTGHPMCGIAIKRHNLINTCIHPYCQGFLKAVIQEGIDPHHPFTFRPGNLANTDVRQWQSHPWELAKLFMNPGQLPTQTSPSQTDLSGIINFLSHCRVPRNQLTNIISLDEVRKARNGIMHTSDMKLSVFDLKTFSQSMIDLLTDPGISSFPRAQLAVTDIQKILTAVDFQITLEDESKVMDKLAGELHALTVGIREKLADVADCGEVEREDIRQKLEQIQDEIKKTSSSYETLKKKADASSVLQDKMEKNLTNIKELLERATGDLKTDLRNVRKQQDVDTESIASLQRHIDNLKTRTQQENKIPSEKAKADLKQYLIDGYQNRKLNITLLPKWIELHVSKIFSPVILVDNKPLGSYKDMFFEDSDVNENTKGGRSVPIFLLGKAGVGKSTLCKHLADAWANPINTPSQFTDANNLQQFKFVFYVSCRFAKEKDSIVEMIENQLFSCKDEAMRNVARHVLNHHPELCLILVDGLDEWKGSATSDTGRRDDIQGVPSLDGVEDCVIFITSRPWRFHALSFDTQKESRRLELNGIKNEADLILDILKHLKDPEPEQLRQKFLWQIRKKNMSELLKTPLMLIIALDVWRNDKVLHKSLCTNYLTMLTSFIRRAEGGWSSADKRLNKGVNYSDIFGLGGVPSSIKLPSCVSVNKLLQRYSGLLVSLGHLACNLLLGKQEQSLVFSKDDCESYLNDEDDEKLTVCLALGILSKTETTAHGIEIVESYSFAHKTFQECLAALWLAIKYADEKSKLYQCVRTRDNVFDYSVLIQFLCGLSPEAGDEFWRYVAVEVIDKDEEIMKYRYRLYDSHSGNAKVKVIQDLILKTMKEARDCCDQQEELVFYCIPDVVIHNGTSDEDISLLCDMMQNNTGYMKSLNMIWSFSSNDQNHRVGRSVSCATDLQRLELIGMTFSTKSSSDPVLDLQKHNRLQVLQLNALPISGIQLPSQEESQLRYLELWGLVLSHDNLVQLCGSLTSLSGLMELQLYDLSCSEHSGSRCLSAVDLSKRNRLGRLLLGTLPICGLLLPPQEESQLRDLDLWRLVLSHDNLVQLCSSLTSWSGLERLWLDSLSCSDHSGSRCLSVVDLKKRNTLGQLKLGTLPICGMLLPSQGESQLRGLLLTNLVLSHDSIVQLSRSLSSLFGLENVYLTNLSCSDHSGNCCLPVIDLQKNHKLHWLTLEEMSVECLLSPTQLNQTDRIFEDYNLSRVSMPTRSWGRFIEGLASSDKTFKVTLNSCNINSDIRDFISSCPQFSVERNDDDMVIFNK